MAINNQATAVRNARANAAVDLIDGGSADATGEIRIYTAAFGALLVSCLFANPAFGAASTGVATANAIAQGTAVASGTAAVGRIVDRDNATLWEFVVGTSGQDLNITNLTIATNDTVNVTAMTYTEPAS